jgi:hypothetical protein
MIPGTCSILWGLVLFDMIVGDPPLVSSGVAAFVASWLLCLNVPLVKSRPQLTIPPLLRILRWLRAKKAPAHSRP